MDLGEKHNGEAVLQSKDGLISKPRTVYWEWLFLGNDSPLRELISDLSCGISHPMNGLPRLKFWHGSSEQSGIVEKLELSKVLRLDRDQSRVVGGTFATAAWFGLTDLHFENVMMGVDKNFQFVFCPIDIECIFEELELFSQTQMVCAKGGRPSQTGAKQLLEKGANVASVCSGFLNGLDFYKSHSEGIDRLLLESLGLLDVPTRVVLRPTRDYVEFLKTGVIDVPFIAEEMIQLRKGDVPYFRTTIASSEIQYMGKKSSWENAKIKISEFDVLPSFYDSKFNKFKRPITQSWVKDAVCQICRTLDFGIDFRFYDSGVEITYKGDHIYIITSKGWRIKCERASQLYFAA